MEIPYIGGLFFDYYIKERFDICLTCRKIFIMSCYNHIANKFIYWDHSLGNMIYQNKKTIVKI